MESVKNDALGARNGSAIGVPTNAQAGLPALRKLAAHARDFALARSSDNTKRAYAFDWAVFERWCATKGLDPEKTLSGGSRPFSDGLGHGRWSQEISRFDDRASAFGSRDNLSLPRHPFGPQRSSCGRRSGRHQASYRSTACQEAGPLHRGHHRNDWRTATEPERPTR